MAHIDIKRRLATDDLSDIEELLSAVERADGQRPLSDHLWIDLRQGGRPGFAGLMAWEPGHDHMVAYCQVSRGNDSWALDLVVSPHHRYEMSDIGPRMLDEAVSLIAEQGGGHVHWWVFEPTAMHTTLAEYLHFFEGRTIRQMRAPLPLADSATQSIAHVTTSPFRVGVDENAWLEMNNRAFADHPEQGGWTREILESRMTQPWFNPNGVLMLHEADQLIGFCWTKVHLDTSPILGEIYIIAVDPDHAGRGLGKALTVAGLRHLHRMGAPMGMLYVDADNVPAVRMYESLGFTTHHIQRAFVGDVGRGEDA
jgi:mycothiol synthase